MFYKSDCIYFKGHIPCNPHKIHGYHCIDCPSYQKVEKRILIIKLGAIGDVIRTTPLVTRYKKLFPLCKITWLTWTPEILPSGQIDEILKFDHNSILYVQNTNFDIAINLDKEKEAGALLKMVNANEKFGYVLKDGEIQPIDEKAWHKFETGLFDDVSKANTRNYCEEIFEIAGLTYEGEPYLLDNHSNKGFKWPEIDRGKKVIGLNTGCGGRWVTRLWEIEKWAELAKLLLTLGYEVILLGGEQEDGRNKEIQTLSGAKYFGYFGLNQFINLVDQCELVVTQVTMGMHITLGLGKKIVLLNNIFNPFEFDLFQKGKIVQPPKECKCFYKGTCVDGLSCMTTLDALTVKRAVEEVLEL